MLGLRKTDWATTGFPFAALFEELHALETLENGTLSADGRAGLEAVVLGHDRKKGFELNRGARKLGAMIGDGNAKKSLPRQSGWIRGWSPDFGKVI